MEMFLTAWSGQEAAQLLREGHDRGGDRVADRFGAVTGKRGPILTRGSSLIVGELHAQPVRDLLLPLAARARSVALEVTAQPRVGPVDAVRHVARPRRAVAERPRRPARASRPRTQCARRAAREELA